MRAIDIQIPGNSLLCLDECWRIASIGINLLAFFNPDDLRTLYIGHGLFCLFKGVTFRWPCCRRAWSIAGWSGPRTPSPLPHGHSVTGRSGSATTRPRRGTALGWWCAHRRWYRVGNIVSWSDISSGAWTLRRRRPLSKASATATG